MRIACLAIALAVSPAAACTARSADRTAALVELYTSAGCSACPAAERWLSGLSERYPGERVIAVTIHVSRLGRPRDRLTPRQRLALVPMPYVLVQGLDFPRWFTGDFDREVGRIHGSAARARLELEIVSRSAARLKARVRASSERPAQLFVGGEGALQWHGPLALGGHEIEMPIQGSVVAFVQDRRTGEVLQALRLGVCSS